MHEIGKSVDDRNRSVLRELLDLRVRKGANHDAVYISGKNSRSIRDRLAPSQLHIAWRKEKRVSTKLPRANFERHSRTCRRFHEDHRQRFSSERLLLVFAAAHRFGERKQLVDFLRREIRNLKEIAVRTLFGNLSGHMSCADCHLVLVCVRNIVLPSAISLSELR